MSKRKRTGDHEGLAEKRGRPVKQEDEQEMEEEENDSFDQSQNPDFTDNTTMGTEAEVGIIEKVMLKNFMCHGRLEFQLGPHVNFLTGRNGSGKSAILTALMVALGGKANITNRGSSLKNFIKSGRSTSEVSVRIRNRGTDAYKPTDYGPSITVTRRLTAEGSSTYKLKNHSGKVVSTKREELQRMLIQLNIQVDNPVAILTQETSRNFLHSKSPQDRYKFFLKATQLETMKTDYLMAHESKKDAKLVLEQKKRTLPELEKEVLSWEQKYKDLSSLDSLREKVTSLKNEIAWATIVQKEKDLAPVSKKLEQEEQRTPRFVEKIKQSQEKVAAAVKVKETLTQEIVDLGSRVTALEPQQTEAKRRLDEKKKNLRQIQAELRQVQKKMDGEVKDRESLMHRIEELRTLALCDYQKEKKAREERIATLQQKMDGLVATRTSTEHSMQQFRSCVNQKSQEVQALKAEETCTRNHAESLSKKLKDLKASRTNKLRRFGDWMLELLSCIDAAHSAGTYLQLRDQGWALAMENCLGSLLKSFCVHDHHDERELENILHKVCPPGQKPHIITSQFLSRVHDVRATKPRCRYPTVLEQLIIQDPVVTNCLIDQRSIETIILIADKDEGKNVMSSNHPPQNVREAFMGNGDQVYCTPLYRYYMCTLKGSTYLTASVEDEIRNKEEELNHSKVQVEQLKGEIRALEVEIRSDRTEERRCQNQINVLCDEISRLKLEIDELKNVEDPAPVDIATLEEDIRILDETIEGSQEQLESVQLTHRHCEVERQEAEKVFREVDRQIKEILEEGDPAKDRLAQAEMDLQKAKQDKKHYDDKCKEHEKAKSDLRKTVEARQKEIEEDTVKAQQLCERIRTRRTVQNLQSEILQIQKRISREEKNRGNPEEITRRYHETRDTFKKIKIEVNQLNNFLNALETVMRHRQHQYFDFRRMIALRAKYFFIVLLSNRQYTGKMAFDHKQEVLTLSVAPNNPASGDQELTREMKALSGGERSFSTVCFILALWDAMESPFRCLDEFDVFMDMVNRRMAMDMMLTVARAQCTRQFIFLTPQDMSQLELTSKDRIFRMRPPERGQDTLPDSYRKRDGEDQDQD